MRTAPPVIPQTSCKQSDFSSEPFSAFFAGFYGLQMNSVDPNEWVCCQSVRAELSHFQILLAEVVMFKTAKTPKQSLTTETKFSWQQLCLEVCENCTVCAFLSRPCEFSTRLFVSYDKRGCALGTCTFSTQLNGPCKIIKCPFTVAGTQQ